ncbi:N-6 DNA methylase [Streptomyces europaeiscabiei]|uniref:N-6 DNA methylase n=1 Tax=Streptomyces europaeiscabiei TaxID=146819 RepID=UPI002E17FBFB
MTSSRAVPVTLAEIARLAGVGRAAVSNWRRRHESFPQRIGGTDVSPQFSLTEIEVWLRDNNKLRNATGRDWLWPQFEALGSRDETGLAIAASGRLMSRPPAGRKAPDDLTSLSERARELVAKALDLGRREGPAETFEFLLGRWLDVNVRQISTTPEPLAALMADLALQVRARPESEGGRVLAVLDPTCGTGHLLAAVGAIGSSVALRGSDSDPVLAALADARLALLPRRAGADVTAHVKVGDSLRADPFAAVRADLVLCNPPFNERDWGYEELATDARWAHGMPPRTEPELAWVQHCLARLRPGGTAVVLLPPAVATRRAGRRIRGALLRTGLLRAVVALPAGSAPPHSVSLQLWVLRVPAADETPQGSGELLLVDGASRFPRASARDSMPDWDALGAFVRSAIAAVGATGGSGVAGGGKPGSAQRVLPECVAAVPVIDLLDDEVDLTPGRHVTPGALGEGPRLADSWSEFGRLVAELGGTGGRLATLDLSDDEAGAQPTTTVGELARAGALTLRSGQQPADGTVGEGQPDDSGVSLLTIPDLLLDGEPHTWLSTADAEAAGAVIAESGDVVVAGVARAFSAWVHQGRPMALGPQLHLLRVHPDQLDAWFLAGSLRAPANARQAGTHASSSSRVDVRKLQVRQVPLPEQQQHSEAFKQVAAFEKLVTRLSLLGAGLVRDLSDELAAGRLSGKV